MEATVGQRKLRLHTSFFRAVTILSTAALFTLFCVAYKTGETGLAMQAAEWWGKLMVYLAGVLGLSFTLGNGAEHVAEALKK